MSNIINKIYWLYMEEELREDLKKTRHDELTNKENMLFRELEETCNIKTLENYHDTKEDVGYIEKEVVYKAGFKMGAILMLDILK